MYFIKNLFFHSQKKKMTRESSYDRLEERGLILRQPVKNDPIGGNEIFFSKGKLCGLCLARDIICL